MSVQWPIDGMINKAWKVTSPFGWRVHPITGAKKHHNGTDIWQAKNPSYIESAFDGKVTKVMRSTDPNSFGNYVLVASMVMGKKITSLYAHMVDGSITVKKGQRIKAGTPLGKMGETGFATGKHLHWEIWKGITTTQPNTMNGGIGFYDPMEFTKAAIAWAKAQANADKATPADAKAHTAPAHSAPAVEGAKPEVIKPAEKVIKPAAAATKPAAKKAAVKPILKLGSKGAAVKVVQEKLNLTADGQYGPMTEKAVKVFQKKHAITPNGVVGAATWKALS